MSWNNSPIRRGQLIMPFGPGNLFVSKDGTSLIIAGIDFWFQNEKLRKEEFIIHDWRLESEMEVKEFRLPPDFRTVFRGGPEINTNLEIPALRFPSYHICSNCKLMDEVPLHQVEFPRCRNCGPDKRPHQLNQARFLTVCQKGHIQDFPWREWVHSSSNQNCAGFLYYNPGQGAGMDSISISCGKKGKDNGCGSKRNLTSAVLRATNKEGTVTNSSLQDLIKNMHYKCKGLRPWLGDSDGCDCDSPPIAALRGSGNVYFGSTRSSLSLPKSDDALIQSICDEIEKDASFRNRLDVPIAFLDMYKEDQNEESEKKYEEQIKKTADTLSRELVNANSEDRQMIIEAIKIIINQQSPNQIQIPENKSLREQAFRRQEYEILQKKSNNEDLIIEIPDFKDYRGDEVCDALLDGIDHISLVKKLVETTALEGFSRFTPSWRDDFKSELMLEKNKNKIDWLPARQSTGEGIFIRFDEIVLTEWEKRPKVLERVNNLEKNVSQSNLFRFYETLAIPRHVLLHSFAHALINELTYSSGYSSSALRERLYVSNDIDKPMAGVLIYTASGDSEGSMGGLVMQGRPNIFEKLLLRTLTKSSWCSLDPVCAVGKDTGPDSCNNSACYSCCLVPEPSCEFSNAGLDRALLGSRALGYQDLAYFVPLEERQP